MEQIMSDVWSNHREAFRNVNAYAVMGRAVDENVGPLADINVIATIAFKWSQSGGTVWCYLHVRGSDMVRASVHGYGLDKRNWALGKAAEMLPEKDQHGREAVTEALRNVKACLTEKEGAAWEAQL